MASLPSTANLLSGLRGGMLPWCNSGLKFRRMRQETFLAGGMTMKRRFAPCCCTKLERMFKKPANDMDQWTSAFALVRLKKVFVPDCCGLLIFCSTYDRSSFVRGVQKNPSQISDPVILSQTVAAAGAGS